MIESVITDLELKQDEVFKGAENIVNAVRDCITISPIRLSRLVEVSGAPLTLQAAAIANKLMQNFLTRNLDKKKQRAFESYKWLQNEVNQLADDVRATRLSVFQFREDNQMPSLEESQNTLSQALFLASDGFQKASDEAAQAVKVVETVDNLIAEAEADSRTLDLSVLPYIQNSPIIQQLRVSLAAAEAELASLEVKYLEKWPAVIVAKEQIRKLTDEIQQQAGQELKILREQARFANERADRARVTYDEAQVAMNRLNELKVEYDNLVMEKEQSEQLYTAMLAKTKEMDLNTKDMMQNLEWWIRPMSPSTPSSRARRSPCCWGSSVVWAWALLSPFLPTIWTIRSRVRTTSKVTSSSTSWDTFRTSKASRWWNVICRPTCILNPMQRKVSAPCVLRFPWYTSPTNLRCSP